MFSKELERFLSGPNTVWVRGGTSDEAVGGGPTDGGGLGGNISFKFGDQRKIRAFENSKAGSGNNMLKRAAEGCTV